MRLFRGYSVDISKGGMFMNWDQIGNWFVMFLSGCGVALEIFAVTLVCAIPLGVLLSFGRRSKYKVISWPVSLYISIMRGTPLLLQLLFVYFAPKYMFGLNYDRFLAALIAFVLNYAAYFAEIFRGGMDSMLKEWKVSGLISMSKADLTAKADLIPFSQHGDDNYIYNGSESYNNLGQKATDEWFESVDTTIRPSRNADGTIDMHNLLVIKSGVLSDNVGARLDTTSEEAISVKPQAGEVVSHVFEWTTTKEATCTEKGEKHGICTICGHEETREIEALGHEFANEFTVDKEATTTEEGSKSQHCLHAGCTEKTNVTVIPKLTAGSEEVNPTPSTPDNKDDANVPSTGTDSSEKAPAAQTGDTMHAVPFALAMIISAGVVVIEISRKKKAVR